MQKVKPVALLLIAFAFAPAVARADALHTDRHEEETILRPDSLLTRARDFGLARLNQTVSRLGLTHGGHEPADDHYLTAFVGDFAYRWPYRSTSVYRPTPAWRYNRVDGVVLGIRMRPLEWDSYERTGVHGQFGYAFASKRLQYEIGAEARLGEPYGEEGADVKFGGSYRRMTATDDLWKSSWAENTLGAFFFNHDIFDYYETEGWSVYSAARISPYLQFSAGFRSEDYRSVGRETGWSLFGGDHFRFNPPVRDGHMQSVVVVVEGGSISRFHSLPSGAVFRIQAELGDGLGGDFDFNRVMADGRVYIRTTRKSSLGLRMIGGRAAQSAPVQKAFTLGGIGSVRGYPQNAFFGHAMWVGNAEFSVSDFGLVGNLLDNFQVSGFFDAGWVDGPANESFTVGDVFTSAGIGLGLFDRRVRLDLAFPLTDRGGSKDPSLWLRLIPAF
ncbi:MAG: BamA/TamA family outer membrane protein [Rhodothermales bacterium]|nr:BamA/TamA family outer membrane protein [Rhodothermales bacterium]